VHIIQDFLKIINHRISLALLSFFSIVISLIVGFLIGRTSNILASVPEMRVLDKNNQEISQESLTSTSTTEIKSTTAKSVIFGSRIGKYFYYKGCGGDTISAKNLVYYKTEAEAIAKGKLLYSKCK